MKSILLGQNGTKVSTIGFGAMSFVDFYGPVDEQQSHKVLEKALELGIDNLDTSNAYGTGLSESRIGSFLNKFGSERDTLFKIATKAGITRTSDGKRYFDNSLAHLESELDKSLKRLNLDRVDLFYVHRRDEKIPIEEVTGSLTELIKKGKIKQFGFSEIAPSSLERANKIHPVAAVQSEYSLSTRYPELGLVQKCLELNTTLVAFSPVGRSLLTDNPHDRARAEKMAFLKNNPRFMSPNLEENINATNVFRDFSKKLGYPAASVAIAWLLTRGPHILPIPGTRSTARLEELVMGASIKLSNDDLISIEKCLPIGWAHGDRYSLDQWIGPERYC
ncbi:MAG: aldo/keto reductase [Paracoccaceae bacterium]